MTKKGEKVKYTKDGKPINIRRYSNSYKLEVARKVSQSEGTTISGVARDHGLPESTLRQWVKDLEKLDSHIKSHGDLKTIHRDKQPTLSRFLRAYCDECVSSHPPINLTAQMISTKAAAISNELLKEYETNEEVMGLGEATALMKMTFSTSWAMEWAKKNQFVHRRTKKEDEAPFVDEAGLLRNELKKYETQYVYCLVDPIFFYKVLPRPKYLFKSENGTIKSTNNMKLKDRVTLYLCTNASGSDKVPLTMIGNSKNPRCFGKDNQLELFKYFNQDNGWSDLKTIKRWFLEVFLPHVRAVTTEKKILLILPFASKELVDDTKQVKCITLPSNDSEFRMPLTMGVIEAFKREYRYHLLKEVLTSYQNNKHKRMKETNKKNAAASNAGLSDGREPHLLDVMEMLDAAWKTIDESFISINWIKAGLFGDASVLPYSTRRRNPMTESLTAAIDSIMFALHDLDLPKDTTKDDPFMDNLRGTYKFYKTVGEDQYVDSFDAWVKLEEDDEVIEFLREEREECLNADEEQFRDSLREIQEALIDPRYMKAVEYLQDARNEFMRVSKSNKRMKVSATSTPLSTKKQTTSTTTTSTDDDLAAALIADDISIGEV